MKTITKNISVLVIALGVIFANAPLVVLAETYDNGYVGSSYDDGYVGTTYNDGYVGTSYNGGYVGTTYNDGYVGTSYNGGYVGTTYNDGYVGTSYNGGYVGTTYNDGYVGTSYNGGYVGTTYNDGYVGTSYNGGYVGTTYNDGYVGTSYNGGYVGTTYNDGYVGTSYNGGYVGTTYNDGYVGSTVNGGYVSPVFNDGYIPSTTNGGYVGTTYNDGYVGSTVNGGYVSPVFNDGYIPSTTNGGYVGTTYNDGYVPSISNGGYVSSTYTDGYVNPISNPGYVSPIVNSGYVGSTYGNGGYVTPIFPGTGTNNPPVITQIVCPAGSNLINGQCINVITGTVITTTVCPAGTVLNGTNCVNTVNGTIVTVIACPAGSTLTGSQCINTINGTVVTNVICPNGIVPTNGQCINTVTPPVTTVTNCPSNTHFVNGTCQQIINPPVVTYQTCWDGAVIPATSVCSQQYKICANGTSVPVNQACYVPPTPIYVPPQVVKFNNVVTSIATQITNTSGRCNGIGLIANNAPSTGWFEYGETANLGRTTASAQIGSSNTAPFSNVLANLKPTTKYYCRAVMQNQYGLVKGEIVSFVTKAKATTYVKPVVITTKKPTKTPVKKNEIVCSDGSTVTVKNETSATLINKGEKLIAVQVEKTDGKLSSGEVVHYKVSYKNLTDSRLTGVLVKVTLPQEIMFTSATVGNFDATTRTLTLNQDTIDPYTEGTILLTGTVMKDAPLGKTVVTNVYALYTVPGTKTQDEVTAYVVGSIVPTTDAINKDTGVKKVVGTPSAKGFMPNSLIEWLALLAIMFIIFILGRSIYASYKDDEGGHH